MATKKIKGGTKVKKQKLVPVLKKEEVVRVPKYELVTFGIKATIPTQQYGNIMPEIIIKAKTIEDASAVLLPVIEKLYVTYSEKPRDGGSVPFMSRASVTVEEKKVEVPKPVAKAPEIKKEGVLAKAAEAPKAPEAPKATPVQTAEELADDLNDRSPAFIKARTAVRSSTSLDALNLIEEQVQRSVKLSADEKPELLTEILKKRKTFA